MEAVSAKSNDGYFYPTVQLHLVAHPHPQFLFFQHSKHLHMNLLFDYMSIYIHLQKVNLHNCLLKTIHYTEHLIKLHYNRERTEGGLNY